jgi:putative addiction module component (TIGR02574 family)
MVMMQEGISMNLKKISDDALHFPRRERTQLIQRLVLSLGYTSEQELSTGWQLEARRRAEEIDNGVVKVVPGEEVMRKARSLRITA